HQRPIYSQPEPYGYGRAHTLAADSGHGPFSGESRHGAEFRAQCRSPKNNVAPQIRVMRLDLKEFKGAAQPRPHLWPQFLRASERLAVFLLALRARLR